MKNPFSRSIIIIVGLLLIGGVVYYFLNKEIAEPSVFPADTDTTIPEQASEDGDNPYLAHRQEVSRVMADAEFNLSINPTIQDFVFTFEIDEESLTISTINVHHEQNNGDLLVVQKIQADQEQAPPLPDFDFFKLEDMNFDGYKDIGLLNIVGATGNLAYKFWLYNPQQNQFEYHEQLSSMGNPQSDPVNKVVNSFWKGGAVGMEYQSETYRFENGRYLLIRKEVQDSDDDDRTFFLRTISELQNGEMVIVSEEKVESAF